MDLAKTVLLDRITVHLGSISFVDFESVLWITQGKLLHKIIPLDLCDYRGRSDGWALRIAFDHILLSSIKMERIPIKQYSIHIGPEPIDLCDGF